MAALPLREKILATIIEKSMLKQRVFDNTFAVFNLLKDTLFEMASEMEDALEGKVDRRVRLEYRDRGKHEAQLQIASDLSSSRCTQISSSLTLTTSSGRIATCRVIEPTATAV